MIVVFLLLIVWIADIAALEVACYHCYGNSTTEGKFCSIDSLCLGQSCYFTVQSSGEWSAGCANGTAPPVLVCSNKKNSSSSTCSCTADLCNQFNKVNETLQRNSSTFNNISLHLPDLPIICLECGNVSIGGRHLDVPCAEAYVCQGSYCITKRGRNPHSYCGTDWEGFNETKCIKSLNEEEHCVCNQPMCNAVLPPELNMPSINSTVSSSNTTESDTSGNATASPKGKKCKNSIKFSPNAQAVFMGQKLTEAIRQGIGSASLSAQEFSEGVDTHICEPS